MMRTPPAHMRAEPITARPRDASRREAPSILLAFLIHANYPPFGDRRHLASKSRARFPIWLPKREVDAISIENERRLVSWLHLPASLLREVKIPVRRNAPGSLDMRGPEAIR